MTAALQPGAMLRTTGLTKRYGKHEALRSLTLSLAAGSFVAILHSMALALLRLSYPFLADDEARSVSPRRRRVRARPSRTWHAAPQSAPSGLGR